MHTLNTTVEPNLEAEKGEVGNFAFIPILTILCIFIILFAITNFIVIRKNKRHLETIHILLTERKITSQYPRKLPRVLPVPSSSVLVKYIKVGETAIYFSSIKEEENVLGREDIELGEEAIYSNLNLTYSDAI